MDICPGAVDVCPGGVTICSREGNIHPSRAGWIFSLGGLEICQGKWILAVGGGFLPTLCPFQVVEDGYEFFAKRQLVTLFSAPNYCGEFDNAGAMMSVDETLMCSFQVSPGRENTLNSCPEGCREFCPPGERRARGQELTYLFPPSPPDFEAGRQEQGQIRAVQRAEPRWAPRHPSPKLCQSQEMSWEPPLCCPRPPAPRPSIRSLFF